MKLDLQLNDLDEDSLDMTPLIDVLFLLLTFFILAATFVAPSMEVELAKADNLAATRNEEVSLIFSIDAEGLIYHEKNQITPEELKAVLGGHGPDVPIVFNVDQGAPFESFMTVLDEARSQDKHKFLISGQPKSEQPG
ncbi:biopolymer transporter ExbD [Deltaproteobacteria bacterium Smac51]|nr:biopolymer transporter ExbD [Deltaproteobacteria bacterium Smac51]